MAERMLNWGTNFKLMLLVLCVDLTGKISAKIQHLKKI